MTIEEHVCETFTAVTRDGKLRCQTCDRSYTDYLQQTYFTRVAEPASLIGGGAFPADPWKHRSAGMRCETCIWFVRKEASNPAEKSSIGRCRRHAPTMGGYPVVYETDWCGDHRLDENKV